MEDSENRKREALSEKKTEKLERSEGDRRRDSDEEESKSNGWKVTNEKNVVNEISRRAASTMTPFKKPRLPPPANERMTPNMPILLTIRNQSFLTSV